MFEVKIQEANSPRVGLWHLFSGILLIALGLMVWFNPMASLMALSLYIGVGLILAGIGYVAVSLDFASGWHMFVGLIDIILGIIFVANLGVTAATLPVFLALWILAIGAAQLVSSYRLKKFMLPWQLSMVLGLAGIIFGFLMLTYPGLGAIAISTILGLYIVLFGVLAIMEYVYFRRTVK